MSSQTILRILVVLVFLGWLLIWIMLPTKTYKNEWTPKLNSKLNSTYSGGQGTTLVLFTFPIMFIAALGCIYRQFQTKPERSHSQSATKNHRQTFWRRPVVVFAPLGIVTAMELVFAAMFVVLLIWSLANYLHGSFGHLHMLVIFVLPRYSGIFHFASGWPHIIVQHQVPYMAWTSLNHPFFSTQHRLLHILGYD